MDSKRIGEQLRKLRGEKTQKEVAEAVGVTVNAISMYETGERIPRDEIKIRFADYFKTDIHQLFFAE